MFGPRVQGPRPLLGEIVTLVNGGDTPELRRLVGEELIDGEASVEAPVRRRSCRRQGTSAADSVAAAALARALAIAASRRAFALEKPEIEVLPVVLKTKSQISPLPPLLSLLRASDRVRNTARAGRDK